MILFVSVVNVDSDDLNVVAAIIPLEHDIGPGDAQLSG